MTQTVSIGKLLLGLLYISIATAILAAVILTVSANIPKGVYVVLGDQKIKVEVADTPFSQEKGLGGHKKLATNEGMLFVFPQPDIHGFWMKDMTFPIDIIWFDEYQQVVDIWENATPDSYPKIHVPKEKSQYVLEVNGGFAAEHNLQKGDIYSLEE